MAGTGPVNIDDRLNLIERGLKEIKEALMGTLQKPGGFLSEHRQFEKVLKDHDDRIIELEEAGEDRETRLKEVERKLDELANIRKSMSAKLWDLAKGPIGHGITLLLGILAAKLIN